MSKWTIPRNLGHESTWRIRAGESSRSSRAIYCRIQVKSEPGFGFAARALKIRITNPNRVSRDIKKSEFEIRNSKFEAGGAEISIKFEKFCFLAMFRIVNPTFGTPIRTLMLTTSTWTLPIDPIRIADFVFRIPWPALLCARSGAFGPLGHYRNPKSVFAHIKKSEISIAD